MKFKSYINESELLTEGFFKDYFEKIKNGIKRTSDEIKNFILKLKEMGGEEVAKIVIKTAINILYRVSFGTFTEYCRVKWRKVSSFIEDNDLEPEFLALSNMMFGTDYRSLSSIHDERLKIPLKIIENSEILEKELPEKQLKKAAVTHFRKSMLEFAPLLSIVKIFNVIIYQKGVEKSKGGKFKWKGETPSKSDIAVAMLWLVLINSEALQNMKIEWKWLQSDNEDSWGGRKQIKTLPYTKNDSSDNEDSWRRRR